jgi:nucleotide-binding universal stress UspA family protein
MQVLFATDGSTGARLAGELIEGIRWPAGSTIHVARVVDSTPDIVMGSWPAVVLEATPEEPPGVVDEARHALAAAVARLRGLGFASDAELLQGSPGVALCSWLERHRPDLAIVGSRGMGRLDRMLLGSVSSELVDRSPVPVLVARTRALRRVLVAVDGSVTADDAVATLATWPLLGASEVRTLSVTPPPPMASPSDPYGTSVELLWALERDAGAAARIEHEAVAAQAAATLRDAGVDADPYVRSGPAAPTILTFAAEWAADLIVVGSHGRTGISRLLLGSVAHTVLRRADCSVLVIRGQTRTVLRRSARDRSGMLSGVV